MTEKLKTLMDEVTGMQDFATPDLDAIVRDGDRTVRRRRTAVGVATLAVAAVTIGGVALLGGGPGTGDAQIADSPVDSEGMSWAVGSVLYSPGSSVDAGHPIRAYVRTMAGFVTVDDKGRVRSVVGEDITVVGQMEPSSLYLVSDTEDTVAAWLEHDTDGEWAWVVFDQATGRRLATYDEQESPDPAGVVVALDDRQLVVKEERYIARNIDDGTQAVVDRPVRNGQLLSLEDGVFAWADPDEDGGSSEYLVGRTGTEPVRIPAVQGYRTTFSPDARWVSFDADEPRIFDSATGEQVGIDVDGRVFATGYEWLDDNSLAVIASRDEVGPVELLVCEVPAGTCDVVEPDLGSFDEVFASGFALAGGSVIEE